MSSSMTPFTEVESNGNKMRTSPNKSSKEKYLIAAVVILAIVLVAFVIAVVVLALKGSKKPTDNVCTTAGCLTTALELLNSINTSADPCEDFNEFACGKWALAPTGPIGSKLGNAAVNNMIHLNDVLITASKDSNLPDGVKKIANAYVTCTNYKGLSGEDLEWLESLLEDVGGWPMIDVDWDEDGYHWESNMAKAMHKLLIRSPLYAAVDINFFNTEDFVLHIHQQPIEVHIPFQKDILLSIARQMGDRTNDPALEREFREMEIFSQDLMKISHPEKDLTFDPAERKLSTIKELQKEFPWLNWLEFFRTIFGPYLSSPIYESEPVIVLGTTYIKNFLQKAFNGRINKRTLANYIAASFVQRLSASSDKGSIRNAVIQNRYVDHFQFPHGFSSKCLGLIQQRGSIAVDFLHYKNRKGKLFELKTLDYFFTAMKDIIKSAKWLDEETRSIAMEKLATIVPFIGYPARVKDTRKVEEYYRGLPNMTGNAFRNQLEIERHFFRRLVGDLRTKMDRNVWPSTEGGYASQTNAFNVGDGNFIVIPGGIQIEPLYGSDKPSYWNFGAFGWVIAHEITHSYDTEGSKRDKYGNMKNWWTPKAKEEFQRRSQCFVDYYNTIEIGYKQHHIDGKKTVGENVADNGGLHQAFLAYMLWEKENGKEKPLPGLEKYSPHQMFFIAAAQPYCSQKATPEAIYNSALRDIHTPMKFRFAAAAANSKDFAEAFKCKSGSKLNPPNKCQIW